METVKVFSPQQVYVGTFIGGPAAGVYYLVKNFQSMGNSLGGRLALFLGIVIIPCIFISAFYLPEDFPNALLPLIYSGVASGVAWQFQVTKEEAAVSEQYSFVSYWLVLGIAAAFLLITAILLAGSIILITEYLA